MLLHSKFPQISIVLLHRELMDIIKPLRKMEISVVVDYCVVYFTHTHRFDRFPFKVITAF